MASPLSNKQFYLDKIAVLAEEKELASESLESSSESLEFSDREFPQTSKNERYIVRLP